MNPDQTVREAVEEGIGGALAAKKRLDEVYAEYAEPDADFDKLAAEQAELEAHHRRGRQREHRPAARDRRRRAAPGAVGRRDRQAVGRREAPRRAVPDAAVQARHAAARRADQPPRRRVGRLARAVPAALSRHRRRDHPRSLLPRQRRRVDPRARPRLGHSVQGQLLDLARAEGSPPRAGAEDRGRAHQGDEEGARVGAPEPEGPPGQEQGAPGALRGARPTSSTRSATRPTRSSSRWPSGSATR